MERYVLALDQGTTSSRAIVFDHTGSVVAQSQREFEQILPSPGVVEHAPDAIWDSQLSVAKEALKEAHITAEQVASVGIANQRETVVLWERDTGRPVCNALVWQSRVSSGVCERLHEAGCETTIRERTGLLIDPYFSGTKITYALERDPELRSRAERGEVLFGTVDSFLIWRLTEGRCHVTDVSNASRTLLMNLRTLEWDDELLELLNVPRAMLPEIRPSSGTFGETTLLGAPIPIAGCAGDQQAATFGQACFEPGTAKNTYGTGCFVLMNTGREPMLTDSKLLGTVGWQIGDEVTYCLEGSIFVGGAVVQWLRDGLGVIQDSSEVEALAAKVEDTGDVYLVPAFVGLGTPHWDPYARGTIVGLTRGTNAAHLALAAVESMAFQSCDVLSTMQQASGVPLERLRVDGGACGNDRLMQLQADLLNVPVDRPVVAETTALGAAYLAGLAVGYWESLDDVRDNWRRQASFEPQMEKALRKRRLRRWADAVERSKGWATEGDG